MILNHIQNPSDIKELDIDELNTLAEEIKLFLIESIEKTGGHLSSNLGTIQLTLAMHYVFDSPNDTFVWVMEGPAKTPRFGSKVRMLPMCNAGGRSILICYW